MSRDELDRNKDYLRILAIFHYIVGGFCLFFSSLFIMHILIGIIALLYPEKMVSQPATSLAYPFFGWIFLAVGFFLTFSGWALGILLFLAGRFLARAKHYLFCFLVAILSCLLVPFGTILGILTILLLSKNSTKDLFKTGITKGEGDAKK